MKRRQFITLLGGTVIAWPLAARAQQAGKMLRVGALSAQPRAAPIWLAFERRMTELGYKSGTNFALEFVQVDSMADYERGYRELAARNVDIMLATGPEISLKSALAVTQTLPVVMLAIDYDPIARGYVTSLARPTGNITGMSLQQIELAEKRVQILKDAFPDLRAATTFWDAISADQWDAAQTAATTLGFQIAGIEVRDPPYDYERALAQSTPDHRGGLIVMVSPFFFRDRVRLAEFALRHRIVSMFGFREWVEAGGLLSYGPNIVELHRRIADYVDRIAKGAKPADLPIEQPTKFEFIINLKTASNRCRYADISPAARRRGDRMSAKMKRRNVIALIGGAAAWPFAVRAQQQAMPLIGFLNGASPEKYESFVNAFRQGLKETGYTEEQNVFIEYRWADGQYARFPEMVRDLIRRQVAVIAVNTPAARIAKQTATNIPIVFFTGEDPVTSGLVKSLSRPGGNATGVTSMFGGLAAKQFGLLRELAPSAGTVAFLVNSQNPIAEPNVKDAKEAAQVLGLQVRVLNASTEAEIDLAFEALSHGLAGALLVQPDAFLNNRRIVALAARHAVPTMYQVRDLTAAGGLISYGPSGSDLYRQMGAYVGKVLKGIHPAELPVLQPTKFELVINLKTAKVLGLAVPDKLLAIADEVIE